jgi:hypothetical protein
LVCDIRFVSYKDFVHIHVSMLVKVVVVGGGGVVVGVVVIVVGVVATKYIRAY